MPRPESSPLPLSLAFSQHQPLAGLLLLTRGWYLWVASILCRQSHVFPHVPPSLSLMQVQTSPMSSGRSVPFLPKATGLSRTSNQTRRR